MFTYIKIVGNGITIFQNCNMKILTSVAYLYLIHFTSNLYITLYTTQTTFNKIHDYEKSTSYSPLDDSVLS